jgi:hypothetical protein
VRDVRFGHFEKHAVPKNLTDEGITSQAIAFIANADSLISQRREGLSNSIEARD